VTLARLGIETTSRAPHLPVSKHAVTRHAEIRCHVMQLFAMAPDNVVQRRRPQLGGEPVQPELVHLEQAHLAVDRSSRSRRGIGSSALRVSAPSSSMKLATP